jgi:hypothetical protein
LTDLQAPIKRVRAAISSKDIVAYQTHYLIKGGRIYAQNGRVKASAPFPIEGEFLVSGLEFERAVDRLPGDFKVEIMEDFVRIKSGRFRSDIRTLPADTFDMPKVEGTKVKVNFDQFLDTLRALRPFVSDNATKSFSLSIAFKGGKAYATNNVAMAMAEVSGLPKKVDVRLPVWAVDYILSVDSPLKQSVWTAHNATFFWDDGTNMQTHLGADPFPDIAFKLMAEVGDCPFEITDDWRSAMLTMSDLGEGELNILKDHVIVGKGKASTRADIKSPTPKDSDYSRWNIGNLLPVMQSATHLDFTAWPKPMTFKWPGVRGLVAARM